MVQNIGRNRIGEKYMESTWNNIAQLLSSQYGLNVSSAKKSTVGAGSDTWFATCGEKKYVVKYPSESGINNPELEPKLCEFLNQHGIPACRFIKNVQGEYVSRDVQGRLFHVQEFIEGKMYGWHEAPEWLLMESARLLGRFHTVLKNYVGLPTGIGENFFQYMTPKRALESYRNSLEIAKSDKDMEVVEDLLYRIALMERFPSYTFDLTRLTCQSTHGDYFISQLLCGENKINAVIDWTTACVHPVVWEIVRSYVYAAPSCKEGQIDMEEFVRYVGEYCKYAPLSEYDLLNMVHLFYYQIAVCDYYGQYYEADVDNRYIYIQQAKLSTKLLRWLENNGDALTAKLVSERIFPMDNKVLCFMKNEPELYAESDGAFWDDEHISKAMLKSHLDANGTAASRTQKVMEVSADWIAELSGGGAGKRLLDLGCGPGCYAELLTERGFQVTGIDFSRRSIEYAEESAAKRGMKIAYHYQNYLEIAYEEAFDVVILIYCDFGVLSPKDRKELLSKIYRALKPGGKLILDVFQENYRESFREFQTIQYEPGGFWSPEPYVVVQKNKYYEETANTLEQYLVLTENNCKQYNIWNQVYSKAALEAEVQKAGFVGAKFYDDVQGNNYTGLEQTICGVFEK